MHATSGHDTGPRKCLVDRGANGIIFGGEDVRVVSLSDRTLDVTVLGGHEMEDLRIGSLVGGVVPTQKGEILAVFDQWCAYRPTPTGKSIISCIRIQVEDYSNHVDDRNTNHGGSQCILQPLRGTLYRLNVFKV